MYASEERQKKRQKKKDDEGQLAVKRQEMDKAKVRTPVSFESASGVVSAPWSLCIVFMVRSPLVPLPFTLFLKL